MLSKISRYVFASLIALGAGPVLWTSPAGATFVSCEAQGTSTFPYDFNSFTTFSTECQYQLVAGQTDVSGQAAGAFPSISGPMGVQSKVTWANGLTTTAHAYAFGYTFGSNGPVQISGCVSDDQVRPGFGTPPDSNWTAKNCGTPVTYISLVVNGA